ncbi:hypothetical protein KSD_57360 [Ktedonobacter sp. SOSP1-85]|nr:hypothetical protein KSD_57360 [Ktedonobacter sp. SOSP1-85]
MPRRNMLDVCEKSQREQKSGVISPKKSEESLLTFTLPERCMLVTRVVHLSANEQDGNVLTEEDVLASVVFLLACG